ncbi:hypothetical protein NDU88_005524 [Pleurodeles waltl]|uniref:Uncharacterized protein n=1 Tax=Pleurodeles waltl TaxID=8319 RepID=A0AAV7NQM6_PLEWA|nr:hypothetical protein NDU88_005524 [Pleurodeles waltl]
MLSTLRFKFGLAGNTRCDSAWTVNRLLCSAINLFERGTESWSWRLVKLTVALPRALKVNLAPKTMRNLGDKGEGARPARVGKDSGEVAPADSRGKDKSQSVIMCFVTGSTQESGFERSLSPPEDTPFGTKENCTSISEEITPSKESKEMSYGSNSPPILLQGAKGWLIEAPGNGDEQRVLNGEEAKVPGSGSMQSQPVEFKGVAQVIQNVADTPPAMRSEGQTGGRHVVNNFEVEARKIGRRKKVPDRSKDGGDTFY